MLKDRIPPDIIKQVGHLETCLKDVAQNEVDIRISQCKKEIANKPAVPVQQIFKDVVEGIAVDGLDLIAKIPDFINIKTGLYKRRRKEVGTSKTNFENYSEVKVPPKYEKFLVADYFVVKKTYFDFWSRMG